MHITGMTIAGIPPFTDAVGFKFDNHVNVFIGPNATGKSVVLRSLQSRTPIGSQFDFQLSDDWSRALDDEALVRRMQRGIQFHEGHRPGTNFVPWTYIPAGRINLPLSHDSEAMSNIHAEGVPVIIPEDELADPIGMNRPYNLAHLLQDSLYAFDGRSVHKVYKTLTDRMRMRRSAQEDLILYDSAESVASQCAEIICAEILTRGSRAVDFVHSISETRGAASLTNVHDKMARDTADSGDGAPFLGDLSSGTQGTFLWIWYMAIKMAEFRKQFYYMSRDDPENWRADPAILLIDEVENNLHPTWQRRVIPTLRHYFPNVQIFATTHSPFVVAGLKAGQVHRLYRDEENIVKVEPPNHADIIGWTMDEILRGFMDVQDPTDDETARHVAELRRLRDEGPRDTVEAENVRQEQIRQLRQLVDRDLLAGGPSAAQRELFEQQFAEALEKYQRSRGLGQENG